MTLRFREMGDEALHLLGAYRPPDAFFATSERTMLGCGAAQTFTESTSDALADAVDEHLPDAEVSIALGALPFDTPAAPASPSYPQTLVVPKLLRTAGPARPLLTGRPPRPVEAPTSYRSVPPRDDHLAAVAKAVARIERSQDEQGTAERLRKAVLARKLELEFAGPVEVEPILHNLIRDNPFGYTFAVDIAEGSTLLGASPELLLSRHGRRVCSHPLAGSAPRSADPERDERNAAALLASAKDRDEHAMVTDAVVDRLRPYCRDLDVPHEPSLVATPNMWHLGTLITGWLRDRDVSALRLAAALHPTPAVCGTPTDAARRVLTELEPFDRGYYAGMVGWVDAEGDGEWAISIRCAQVSGSSMSLYAGGGIVATSDPVTELDETSAKFRTLLQAMGLELSI